MEGAGQRDDSASVRAVFIEGIFARRFDRALVRLGARIGEEHARQPRARAKPLGQLGLRRGIIVVGGVCERAELLFDRRRPDRVAVAERVDRDAAAEVDVAFSVAAEHLAARRARELERQPPVSRARYTRCPFQMCSNAARLLLFDEHGAQALVGQHLDDDGVGHAPVDDEHLRHAAAARPRRSTRPSGSSRR